jgi:hypothetical protein
MVPADASSQRVPKAVVRRRRFIAKGVRGKQPNVVLVELGTSRHQIDLDERALRKSANANARSGRPAICMKVATVRRVHGCVVTVELQQVDAHRYDILKIEIAALQNPAQIS